MHTRQRSRLLRGAPILLLALCALFLFTLQISPQLAGDHAVGRSGNDAAPAASTKLSPEEEEQERHRQLKLEEQKRLARIQWVENRRSVIEPVVVADDEGMRHLGFTHDIAIPTPIPPWTESDMAFLQTALGQSLQADLLTSPEIMPDFKTLTVQQRVFKSLFQYFDQIIAEDQVDYRSDPRYKDAWSLYLNLEKTLYPWLQPHWENAFQITNQTSGRGIVICIGNYQFQYAATTIRSIREVLKSDLPIEVFYIRDDDLSQTRRLYLETEFTNVKTRKVIDYINDWYTRFGGWALKPYAILASSFREVILMDADAYFFKKPDTLFDDAGYRKTGALFFYDRTLFPGWETGRLWLSSFLPTKSSLVENSRWWKFKTAHEQESGVVVMDKRRSMLGLLATCKMNDRRERDHVTYKHIHGDKETFWVGFEMMQTPYAFIKSYGAVIGGLGDAGDPNIVCGNQLHLGVDRKPLWWNGGLLRDKNRWPDRYLKFTHYAEGQDWHFENSCIKETDRIREFTKEERELALKYVELDRQRRKDEELIQQGLWQPRQQHSKQEPTQEEKLVEIESVQDESLP